MRLHASWMLAVARRILDDAELAQDCVPDSFISALQKLDTFEGRSTLKTWLHRIVVNAALMKLPSRRRANEQTIDNLLPESDSNDCRLEAPWQTTESPDHLFERNETAGLVREKINELPETYRIVLMLRDIEELSTRDVAELLEITRTTVKVRLHRPRAALKTLIEPMLRGER